MACKFFGGVTNVSRLAMASHRIGWRWRETAAVTGLWRSTATRPRCKINTVTRRSLLSGSLWRIFVQRRGESSLNTITEAAWPILPLHWMPPSHYSRRKAITLLQEQYCFVWRQAASGRNTSIRHEIKMCITKTGFNPNWPQTTHYREYRPILPLRKSILNKWNNSKRFKITK